MSESERPRIEPLSEGQDYGIWKIRIEAAWNAKGLSSTLERENSLTEEGDDESKFLSDQRKASGIIVSALSNEALRVVRNDVNNPYRMLQKLGERYDSKTAASRIARMTELISMRYSSIKSDVGKHIDRMKGILEKLESMNTSIPEELSIALLISSIDAEELIPVTAALKTLSDRSATWETVSARLLEEQQAIRSKRKRIERVNSAKHYCHICDKPNHRTEKCWLNPKNPDNRLHMSETDKEATGERSRTRFMKRTENKKKQKDQPSVRAAPARSVTGNSSDCVMMLDSGTSSHMTRTERSLTDIQSCSVPIALGDKSLLHADRKGIKRVRWTANSCTTEVHLSNTLCSSELAMDLLSVPALAEKGFVVLFTKEQALILDRTENFRVVGIAPRDADGLYYIGN
ncbi:Copia protein [Gracilariopsis chorda]|uniref:Copia protein n=1 Tax=Gracilariopsis chorda TaxID=448386 RepID=A0A2V3IC49_9FLOR|nr:Copia protein [Gracilariopsis chorda]PXF39865.1 Copia protein [Gracilariopsis chorda]|eukprot:PXF39675.1 Copia protein [Gracilariopsis chorda]